jgi:hypothetical protein
MQRTSLALAVTAVLAVRSAAQSLPPLEAGYNWSLSGKEYVLASVQVEKLGPVSLSLSTGWETRDSLAHVWGPSLVWSWSRTSGFYAGASATLLFGAQRPDVAIGIVVGFRL